MIERGNSIEKRFKEAVERNFDQSVQVYDLFEEKHRLFESLTRRQIELIEPTRPKRILDVGCGTGVSVMTLHKSLIGDFTPIIYAIDISEAMINKAKERCRDVPGLYFIRGDAEKLDSFFHEGFDAIFYTASVFLLPKFKDSIRQACGLLGPEGVISISYYSGLFTEDGEEAIPKVFPDLKYQYSAVPIHELVSCINSLQGFRTTWVDFHFEANSEFLFDFLSIPAQSSGLFPKIPYLDRIPRIREFCYALEGKVGKVFMGWKFCIARKSMPMADCVNLT